jgi:hypothetical protein
MGNDRVRLFASSSIVVINTVTSLCLFRGLVYSGQGVKIKDVMATLGTHRPFEFELEKGLEKRWGVLL